jgi:hypothetical protein
MRWNKTGRDRRAGYIHFAMGDCHTMGDADTRSIFPETGVQE